MKFARTMERGTMKIKDQILALFEENKGKFFSGEELAGSLSVSRAAVWKAVNTLRNEGYAIDAVTNKGYCMSVNTDILSPQGIRKYLKESNKGLELLVFSTVSSTNSVVKERAGNGCAEGLVVISNEQTEGRGRRGRSFFSPDGTGVYLSLLLRPKQFTAEQATKITTMAAVAMCEAIEEVSGEQALIKWVNDIYVHGKKVCGILTEASFDMESGLLDYAVLGVGVNVYKPREGFPEEIRERAGAVFENTGDDRKNRLVAAFLNRFMEYYEAKNSVAGNQANAEAVAGANDYIKKYRERSLAIGQEIVVLSGNQSRNATAYGVDEECRLLVRYEDGETESLSSGEISIRLSLKNC